MPIHQAASSEPLEVSESAARAFNQLQAIIDALNDAIGGSVLKVLQHLAKPAADGGHRLGEVGLH